MKAVVLAGGLGTRLAPVVSDRPKPMADIDGEPFLALLLRRLQRTGIREVVLCVGHRAQQVVDGIGDGQQLGLRVQYSVEDEPLGTAGALYAARTLLSGEESFFLLNGDTFVDVDPHLLRLEHRKAGACATFTLCRCDQPDAKGIVSVSPGRKILSFDQRDPRATDALPRGGAEVLINAGFYCLSKRFLSLLSDRVPLSLEKSVFPLALAKGETLAALISEGRFIDIGTPQEYRRAQAELRGLLSAHPR